MIRELELILLAAIAYLLWRILRTISAGITFFRTHPMIGAAPSGSVSEELTPSGAAVDDSVSEEPYIVDDEPWEDGGGWTHLYPSQRKFMRKDWWIPGECHEDYDYRVSSDGRVMCRLRHAAETGTKSGDAPFEERYYQGLDTVKDGVVIEEAVHFIRGDSSANPPTEEITELTAKTEWHELIPRSSWPELWYHIIKIHVGEYEARHGIRKELERLKRGLRIISEQTNQWFTVEHDERFLVSEFKPRDQSSPEAGRILQEAVEQSGITLKEAEVAYFRIRVLSTLLGDTKEENNDRK